MKTNIKKYSLQLILGALLLVTQSAGAADRSALQMLKAGWEQPARTYKPHTRWWWPGNVLTKGRHHLADGADGRARHGRRRDLQHLEDV